MRFTVGTWNLCAVTSRSTPRKAYLLGHEPWDVMLLQEVRRPAFEHLCDALGLGAVTRLEEREGGVGVADGATPAGSAALALALRDSRRSWRDHGAAVLVRAPWTVVDVGLMPLTGRAGPEDVRLHLRSMWCVLTDGRRQITVLSAHAQDAAGSGDEARRKYRAKMRQYRSLDAWVRQVDGPLVVGMDVNGWTDFAEESDIVGPLDEQGRFLAPGAAHGLVDAAREVLVRDRPEEVERRRRLGMAGADGALEVTYTRSAGKVNRMDRIFVSQDIRPLESRTLFADGLSAGSDHAMVLADLRLG